MIKLKKFSDNSGVIGVIRKDDFREAKKESRKLGGSDAAITEIKLIKEKMVKHKPLNDDTEKYINYSASEVMDELFGMKGDTDDYLVVYNRPDMGQSEFDYI